MVARVKLVTVCIYTDLIACTAAFAALEEGGAGGGDH